jgi:hypothetical protein
MKNVNQDVKYTIRLQTIERTAFAEQTVSPQEMKDFRPDRVNLQFQTTIGAVAPEKTVKISLKATATLQPNGKELFQIATATTFVIENFERLPIRGEGKDMQIDFPQELIVNLVFHAYATTRGVLWQSLQTDAYRALPLPMIDPHMLLPRNPTAEQPS